MGSHRQTALANVVLGSVATQALARCKVPVLFIRWARDRPGRRRPASRPSLADPSIAGSIETSTPSFRMTWRYRAAAERHAL